jgi:hypothetical protein
VKWLLMMFVELGTRVSESGEDEGAGGAPCCSHDRRHETHRPAGGRNEALPDVAVRETDRVRAVHQSSPKGWQGVLISVCRGIADDRILANAAAVTFYAYSRFFRGLPPSSRFTLYSPIRAASPSTLMPSPACYRAAPSK